MRKLLLLKNLWYYLILSYVFIFIGYIVVDLVILIFNDFNETFGTELALNFFTSLVILTPVSVWYTFSPENRIKKIRIYWLKSSENLFKYLIITILTAIVLFAALNALSDLLINYLPVFPGQDEMIDFIRLNLKSIPDLIIWLVVVDLVISICEEFLFRGFAFKLFRVRYGFRMATLFTIIFFLMFHPSPAFIPSFIIGNIIICKIYDKTDSLLFPIIIHFIINAGATCFVYFDLV